MANRIRNEYWPRLTISFAHIYFCGKAVMKTPNLAARTFALMRSYVYSWAAFSPLFAAFDRFLAQKNIKKKMFNVEKLLGNSILRHCNNWPSTCFNFTIFGLDFCVIWSKTCNYDISVEWVQHEMDDASIPSNHLFIPFQ